MTKTYTFARQHGLGKWGEERVVEHMNKKEDTVSCVDISTKPELRSQGIDFLWMVKQKDGSVKTLAVDVKMDMLLHRTGNVFIETMSSREKEKEGNFLTSTADYFVYYDPFGNMLYYYSVKALKAFWERGEEDLRKNGYMKKVRNKGYTSEGFVIDPDLLTVHTGGWREPIASAKEV